MPSTSTLVDSIYTRRVSAGECYPPDLVKSRTQRTQSHESPSKRDWTPATEAFVFFVLFVVDPIQA